MRKLSVSVTILQVAVILSLGFAPQLAGTSPTGFNFLANGDFETGNLTGWNVGGVCQVDNSTVHSGQFSAYVSDVAFNSWISQHFYPETNLCVDDDLILNGWVFPSSVGSLGSVAYPFSVIRLYFVNATSGDPALMVSYDWCWNEYENNVTTAITFLLDFQANQWNLLSRNVTSDIYSFYGNMDYSNVFLSYITCLYHFSDVSPGAFYVDELELTSSAEAREPLISVQPPNTVNNSPTQGMRFHVNITIQNVSNCGSLQMTLIFNGTQIALVGVSFLPDANLPTPMYFQSGNGFMSTNVTFGSPIRTVSPVTIIDLTFKLYNRYCESSLHIDSLVVADLSGQILQSDSEDGYVQIRLTGDLNRDSAVDISDAIILANAYGSTLSAPNWNPDADINGDGTVDIYDAIILVGHLGT